MRETSGAPVSARDLSARPPFDYDPADTRNQTMSDPRRRNRLVVCFLTVAAILAGCAGPIYREPPAADNPATLVGREGTYVNEVDGVHVKSAEVANEAGGNSVRVTPGERRIGAYTMGTGARAPGQWRFRFKFEPGRTYELSPGSEISLSLQVRDVASGTVVNVN